MMHKKQKYAQVIVDIPALELNMRTFSYSIPDEIMDSISIGSPVTIPFGKQDPVFGYVVGFTEYIPEGIKVKPIFEILDDEPLFDLKYLEFIEWVANYYSCGLVSAISAAIPAGLWSSTKRMVILADHISIEALNSLKTDEQKICQTLLQAKNKEFSPTTIARKTKLTRNKIYSGIRSLKNKGYVDIKNVIGSGQAKPKLIEHTHLLHDKTDNKRYKEILSVLADLPDNIIETKELLKAAHTTRATIKKLEEKGFIELLEVQSYRNPLERFSQLKKSEKLTLTSYQQEALSGISQFISKKTGPGPVLLYGVTGSGKTEVYFQLIEKTLNKGLSAIFLVPEITLTSQISARMIARFGPEKVGIWHSSLSTGERLDIWKRIHSGEIKVVLGARSGVFAPVQNLGLIIIDEEHESAYKQDTPAPRYHAREVAIERAKRYGATVVLGSATPDTGTYYRTINTNNVFTLPYRIEERPMAEIAIVDMKEEMERGNKSIFSRKLSYEFQQRLELNQQTILLINRRGYTTYIFCRACGYVAECKNCSIPLIYHYSADQLRCHYCNYKIDTYKRCPECDSPYIKHFGTGTQKVEQELSKKFPQARILRLDSDVTSRKNAHYEIIEDFSEGKADVLIGTQMVAKGLDLPNVTLVGVLASDSSFTFPDYRAMERGFQLLTQVAGRAGRGVTPGKVVFQTYSPDIYPILCAQKQDYFSFYSLEILEREKYHYPPFSQLIRVVLTSDNYVAAFAEAMQLTNYLNETFGDLSEKIAILGPADCIIQKIQNRFRLQILIKNLLSTHGHTIITTALRNYTPTDVRITVDVDPLNML
jgi:primosomal protein N' (replication factor Y)